MSKEQWLIVCTDLHMAFGFFESERDAEYQSIAMTASRMHEEGCVFQPIPLTIVNKVEEEAKSYGQYL